MRNIILLMLLIAVITGCAHDPVVPASKSDEQPFLSANTDVWRGPYRLWGEYYFYINDGHDSIDVVPKRQGRLHLNALKFLESYCSDCLKITGLKNNGDGTIDLTVQITHPFPGMPQYTGFDVKGIVMFNGSYVFEQTDWKFPLYPEKFRVSWRNLGDPELLNADGYTYRWSPWYDSGSDKPIFNYWAGKYSSGTPTANINGFLYFYSNEERHMFQCDESVSRTYHISLPPGPVVAGYAVEACWEPPLVNPVVNPVTDFPITANQPECYRLKVVVNDGEPITEDDYDNCCNYGGFPASVHGVRLELDYWYFTAPPYELKDGRIHYARGNNEFEMEQGLVQPDDQCDGVTEKWKCIDGQEYWHWGPATYKFIGLEWHHYYDYPDLPPSTVAVDVFEVVVE
jgi:hypothetical protein